MTDGQIIAKEIRDIIMHHMLADPDDAMHAAMAICDFLDIDAFEGAT